MLMLLNVMRMTCKVTLVSFTFLWLIPEEPLVRTRWQGRWGEWGARLFWNQRVPELQHLKRGDMLLHSLSHTDTDTHTAASFPLPHSLCPPPPGWSKLFILWSTSAGGGEMLSLGRYKYPRAVESALTDAADKRGSLRRRLMLLWMTYIFLRKTFHIEPDEIMDH